MYTKHLIFYKKKYNIKKRKKCLQNVIFLHFFNFFFYFIFSKSKKISKKHIKNDKK